MFGLDNGSNTVALFTRDGGDPSRTWRRPELRVA
jgi:hypothetical protein